MAQFARPISDATNNGGDDRWFAFSGSDMYAMLDETPYSDSDFVSSTDGGVAPLNVAHLKMDLTSLTDPVSSSGHVIRYRIQYWDAGGFGADQPTVHVQLRVPQQSGGGGEFIVWSRTHTSASNTLNEYSGGNNYGLEEHTLSASEANNIYGWDASNTGYNSLKFVIQRNETGMAAYETILLSHVEFEIPAVSTTTTTTAAPSSTQRRVRLESLGFGTGIE